MYVVNTKQELVKILKITGVKVFVAFNSNRCVEVFVDLNSDRCVEVKKVGLLDQLEYEIKYYNEEDNTLKATVFYNPESGEVEIFDL